MTTGLAKLWLIPFAQAFVFNPQIQNSEPLIDWCFCANLAATLQTPPLKDPFAPIKLKGIKNSLGKPWLLACRTSSVIFLLA